MGYEFSEKIVLPGGMTRCNNRGKMEIEQERLVELQKMSAFNTIETDIGLKSMDLNGLRSILD